MSFTLEPLPWDKTALQPHISSETIDFHYGKHHAGYVTTLNTLVKDTPNATATLDHIVMTAEGRLYNIAAQHWNHTFYWHSLSPKGGNKPTGVLAETIDKDFGSFDKFKEEFSTTASGHFGSGWAWLVYEPSAKKLKVVGTHDAHCPIRDHQIPLITCDVWEHAYYIDYRNARADYIKAWWSLVNWEFAAKNFEKAQHSKVIFPFFFFLKNIPKLFLRDVEICWQLINITFIALYKGLIRS